MRRGKENVFHIVIRITSRESVSDNVEGSETYKTKKAFLTSSDISKIKKGVFNRTGLDEKDFVISVTNIIPI